MEVVATVGGALLSASFKKLFDKLASSELRQFASKKEVQSQLQIWENMLTKIHAVLEDAEEKQRTSRLVEIWLSELRDLVYDVEDVLDEFATEALQLKLKDKQESAATSGNKVKKFLPALFTTGSRSRINSTKFNAKMVSKLKKITARMETICTQNSNLHLVVSAIGGIGSSRWSANSNTTRVPTTSLSDSHVFGRDKDKLAILDLLLANEPSDAVGGGGGGVPVIPIQGMGGLGKTTLAQQLYNDERVELHFDLRAWVCVTDSFDILRITKTIIQSFGGETRDDLTLDLLQVELGSILFGKKFLIVLDDVWNEKYEDWTILYKPFKGVMLGSKIVVTTRNHGVASIMSSIPAYRLRELSYEDCLSLFAQHALGATDFNGHLNLKDIGMKIAGKCKGLPLAAKTLGGLLRPTLNHSDWEDVLNNKIWNFPENKSDILPALRLSYQHLPSHLKQCFAYCAVFPKGYEFDMNELVLLWMAEGFLPQTKGKKHSADVGAAYFCDLLSRSFFQQSNREHTRFVMHDLVHDLAQFVAGDTCVNMDVNSERLELPSAFQKVRHSSFIRCPYEVSKRFEHLGEGKCLRTLLALPIFASHGNNRISNDVLNKLLLQSKRLRALSLSGYKISEVPEVVNGLKHLRYLNLSKTNIMFLPEFVGSLLNLQTLLLRECDYLLRLPASIGNLHNLCHLGISGTRCLKEMPVGIGSLTCLQSMPKFMVGQGGEDGLNIRELKDLLHLKGELSIVGLQNVKDLDDARNADLKGKKGLEMLAMAWKDYLDDQVTEVIGGGKIFG